MEAMGAWCVCMRWRNICSAENWDHTVVVNATICGDPGAMKGLTMFFELAVPHCGQGQSLRGRMVFRQPVGRSECVPGHEVLQSVTKWEQSEKFQVVSF